MGHERAGRRGTADGRSPPAGWSCGAATDCWQPDAVAVSGVSPGNQVRGCSRKRSRGGTGRAAGQPVRRAMTDAASMSAASSSATARGQRLSRLLTTPQRRFGGQIFRSRLDRARHDFGEVITGRARATSAGLIGESGEAGRHGQEALTTLRCGRMEIERAQRKVRSPDPVDGDTCADRGAAGGWQGAAGVRRWSSANRFERHKPVATGDESTLKEVHDGR